LKKIQRTGTMKTKYFNTLSIFFFSADTNVTDKIPKTKPRF